MPNQTRNSSKTFLFLALALLLWPAASPAKELKVVFSAYTPPFVLTETHRGIVIDIVTEALAYKGYQVKPYFESIGRSFELFSQKQVDATTIIQESSKLKAFYSADFMHYHNVAISLKSKGYQISQFADFKDLDLIAFQNAHIYLGPEFAAAVAGNPHYKEIANQEQQVLMLLSNRTNLAVMDRYIFTYYRGKLINEGKATPEQVPQLHELFKPTPYKAAFVDAQVRDDFNSGLEQLKKSGRYDQIYREYSQQYFHIKQR
ncbi:MAG: ABC transporter substrate-binding protein [bacterium]|nr:ABC transporter substrate-binding protein [bacterium]